MPPKSPLEESDEAAAAVFDAREVGAATQACKLPRMLEARLEGDLSTLEACLEGEGLAYLEASIEGEQGGYLEASLSAPDEPGSA